MPSSDKPKPPTKIASGKYEIDKRLGAGCFGEVFRGYNTETKEVVAIKFEDVQGHTLQLEHEVEILKILAKPEMPQGVAECHHFGREQRYNCMVMELLGKALEDRVQGCQGKFNVKTTVLIADQVIQRIEYLHSKGIIHRDIKPENFMFGMNNRIHHIYLIDFGLNKRYYDQKHVQVRTRLSLTGTARYASINAHRGVEQSRRDDLEAIGHMFMYFLRGHLPWSGLEAKTQEEKYRKIREKKEEVALKELCNGYPEAFETYLSYSRNLDFKERPDYAMLRNLFRDVRAELAAKEGKIEDHAFPWLEGKNLGQLDPLQDRKVTQPDEVVPGKKMGFCLCGGKSKVED